MTSYQLPFPFAGCSLPVTLTDRLLPLSLLLLLASFYLLPGPYPIPSGIRVKGRFRKRNLPSAWQNGSATGFGVVVEEYLTIAEVAARLKVKPKTIKNKMATGIFRRGVHFFSPAGLGPRFKWSAVVTWLEQSGPTESAEKLIPMARGCGVQKARGLDIADEVVVKGHYVRS